MTEGYEEDLAMYEEAATVNERRLDCRVLMRPLSELDYILSQQASMYRTLFRTTGASKRLIFKCPRIKSFVVGW